MLVRFSNNNPKNLEVNYFSLILVHENSELTSPIKMIKTKKLHILLVALQFGGIFYFMLSGMVFPQNAFIFLIYFIAIFIGFWAIFSMNNQTINVLPDVRQKAVLTKSGPYKLIRHPMYTAVLGVLLGMLLNDFSILRSLVYICVIFVLLFKISVEEKMLYAKYPDYKDYSITTKKLIPFLY